MVDFNKRFVQLVVVFCGEFQPTRDDICSDIYSEFQPICSDNRSDNRSDIYSIKNTTNKSTKTEMQVWDRNTVGMGVYTLARPALE